MKNKFWFNIIFAIALVFSISSVSLASEYTELEKDEHLTQEEIDTMLTDNNVMSPYQEVTSTNEIMMIEKYYQENPEAQQMEIEEVLDVLNLEDIPVISEEELSEYMEPVNAIRAAAIPNLGSVHFYNPNHTSANFRATLRATNIGLDRIDQIGGRVYGYAILPNKTSYTQVLNSPFNETSVNIGTTKIRDVNIAHYKKKAKFVADYIVRDGKDVVKPPNASVEWQGPK